jgi:hypothetical protein
VNIKTLLIGIAILLFIRTPISAEQPLTITFDGTAFSPVVGLIDGAFAVTVSIHEGKLPAPIWSEFNPKPTLQILIMANLALFWVNVIPQTTHLLLMY